MGEKEELWIQGSPMSEGIAIGSPFFLHAEEDPIPEFPITIGEVDDEIARYRKALFSSREDLQRLQKDLAHEGSDDAITIIDSHIQMLEDPLITTQMEDKIRQMLQNTESVFHSVIVDYEKRYSQMNDLFFQQRLIDVMDLAKRVLRHLCPKGKVPLPEIPFNSIVFANELIPSYTAAAQISRVHAFVTRVGGGNSHAALIARAKGIPYVVCSAMQQMGDLSSLCVIVDGQTGDVIFNPTLATLRKYQQKKTCIKTNDQILQKELQYKTETIDGASIRVLANIGHLDDLTDLKQVGADGVGLFRTEYLFFHNQKLSSSEELQYQTYAELIQRMGTLPVMIRVFDVGGDKNFDCLAPQQKEANPVLGCRGIRFLLRYREIFKTQLRAILRAAVRGDARILLPLISDITELEQARVLIHEIEEELQEQGVHFKRNVPVGCMIEVPSAVLICDALARQSDFLSIGTNDLIQYTLGIDRSHPFMGDACYPAHPSVVRMINMVVMEARRYHRPVSICGEIASNPVFIPLLLGLGIDEFSCSSRYVPSIKRVIRQTRLIDACALGEKALLLTSCSGIARLLTQPVP